MKYLSRNDLETIGGRVIEAYKRLPAISGQALERVDIDFLCQELLGLRLRSAISERRKNRPDIFLRYRRRGIPRRSKLHGRTVLYA